MATKGTLPEYWNIINTTGMLNPPTAAKSGYNLTFDIKSSAVKRAEMKQLEIEEIINTYTKELEEQRQYLLYLKHHSTVFKGTEIVIPFYDKVKWKDNLATFKGLGFEG